MANRSLFERVREYLDFEAMAGLGHFHFHVSSLTPLADGCASSSAFAPALGQCGLPLSVINRTAIRPNPVRRTAS